MNYAVDWTDDALSALAAAWMLSPNRPAVTAADAQLDRLLAADPHGNGRPLSEGLYVIDVPPLRVGFEIDDDQALVTVVSVGLLA
jgi:hypothetical protein